MQPDPKRIIPTAVLCAYARRDFTAHPYAQEIADALQKMPEGQKPSAGALYRLIRTLGKIFPPLLKDYSILDGRYRSTDLALQRFGAHATLEIASGLSPRGFAENDGLYMDTDLPPLIKVKEAIAKAIGRQRKGHLFLPLNALVLGDLIEAGEAYKRSRETKPLVVVCEGLLQYFSPEEKRKARDNIRHLLERYSPNGAWTTPDLSFESVSQLGFLARMGVKKIEKETGRRITGFSPEQAAEFLSDGGFSCTTVPNDEVAEWLIQNGKVPCSPTVLREVAKTYKPWVARLAD